MMSSPIMGKGDTDDGNRPSNSGTSDKTIQLNKIILNQKGLCALDAGKQQLQNLQGCNIFILSPTQLKNLGLVAKMKNGKPVIMHESKGGSTTESITEALSINQLVPLLESRNVSPDIVALDRASVTNSEGHLEVMEVSAKSHSVKESAIVDENKEKGLQYVKMSGGVKRRRLGETAGNEQKQPELLKSKDSSEDGSVMNSDNKDKSVVSGDSVPKSMQLWRYETQRHLPRFAVHWQLALAEIGHINCPMMECNYISLSEADMFNHYLHCDGKSSIECNTCPICMCRLGTENDLKTHMLKSHPGDGFHRKTLQQVMIKNKWEVRPKVKLLAKRRSFCKVHRVSWNIAIESKGYVKCLFQNCSYLAITVDEMIKHYGICNGGGDIGGYPYPYKCPHCGGCVETEEKLRTHMEKSHTTEQSSYQTKLLPSSSKTIKKEEVLSTVTLMKPIKLETKENKDSSYCKDSFIITLNAPDGNDTDDTVCTEHIQFVSVDKIKTEVSTADGYDDDAGVQNMYPPDTGELHHYTTSFPVASVKSCRSSEMLPVNQVLAWKDDTAPKEPSGAQEEQNVAKVIGVKEIYCQKKEKADDIVIERVEKSVDSGSTDHENIPDVSIQLVKPVLFTARMESGAVNSEQTPDGSTCTVEKPVDCVSTEMDLKQHTYMENYLFSSDLSSSEQSDDIDVKPDIIENDTLSYLNMHHVKQYSSIYSNDSYKGKFYRKMKSEVDCVADILGAGVAEQFDGCKNMEHQLVNDDRGIASRSVLKTYSRRALRALSNTTEFRFSSKSVKGVTCLKKEESDITAGQLNEPVDQCGGQGTFHDNCSDNNITRSHLRDAGSTGLFSIVDKQRKADSDVWEKIETCQNAQKSRSSSGAALIPEGISELVSGSECVNNMETNISTVKDTEVLQSGRKIYTHAIVTSYVPERKSEHRVSSEGVDTMENDVSTVMDTEALQSGRKRDTNSGGTDCVPEGKTEHCVGSECVDAMETDVSTMKDAGVLQSGRRRDTSLVGPVSIPEGNSEHTVSSECVDGMQTNLNTVKDTEILQSERTRDTSSVGTDCVPEGNSEHCVSSECVDTMETNVSTVKDTEVPQSERTRDTNSVGTDCVTEGNSEHCISSECVDAMETVVSAVKDTEVLQSGRARDTNSVGTDCVPEGNPEHCDSSECVDAMETDVSTVKDTEVLKSGRTRDTNSVGTDCVPEGNSEHCVGSECVDAMETDVSTVKDTEVVQSGRTSDTHSVGTDCVPEGISEHCVSSESVDVMGAYVSIVKDSELQQSGGRRDTSSVGPDSVPEGNMEHTVSSECVDAMETDVSTVKNTEVLQSGRRKDTNSVEIDRVSEGKLVCHAGSECVDAQETNISIVKDAKVMQSKRKRETPSRHTAHVHEGNSKHHATSECMHALETDINTLKDTEVMRCGRTSIGAAHVSEENLTHSASSESVDTIERNVSTVKDTEIMQSEREKDAPLGQTAHVPEGNSKHHAISECVDGMKTVINTLGDTEVMLQSARRRDSHSVGTAHVTEGNLDCHASLECVDIMEMNISIVKDTELMQSERRRDEPSIGTAHVPEGNLECDASSECLNAMEMTVSTVKDTELMQLERRRETPSIGTAHFPEGNLAHCASSECVDTMETNIRTVKDTKLVQSGRGRDRLSRGTATVLEGNLEQSVSSEFVDAMETSVSTLKDTEVVPSGRRRGRPSRGTASVPEGKLAHLASAECMDTMEMNVSTVKDEKVVQSGKRRGRPPKVTASVREGKLELISSPGYVDAMQANVSTVKRAEVVQCGRRRGRPPKVTASVAEGNLARCASSECMDTMEMNVSTVKDTEVLQSGRKRGRPPKVTACVPEGNLAHYVSSECKDTMETNVSTVKDTEIVHSGRRRGRPPKVTASVAEGNVEHCASSEYVDIMEPNPSTVIETERRECGQSGRRRGRPPRVRASVSEGSLELISVPECVDSMETDDNILNGTKRQQNGQSVRSGRGRGRSRGRGCRGRGRNSLAQHVLRKERELEQSADGDSLLKVKCGKCSEEMQKKFFERHNRMKHCGLGWIEGADPIDLNDEKSLLRILTKVHHTRKWLTCETCGANKRSVVGFISHLQCCQKSIEERQMMKMECEICGRSMLPVSLKVHMSTVHKNPPKVEEVITLEELEEQSKMKRAAATKAVSRMQEFIGDEDVGDGNEQPSKHFDGLYLKVESRKINNFTRGAWKRSLKQLGKVCCRHVGCNVESKTLEEALEHYLNCSMAPKKGYVCRTCSFHCEEEPEMLSHVTSAHGNSPECSDNSDADSESELETEDEEKPSKKKPRTVSSAASRYKAYAKLKTANKMKFLLKESSGPVVGDKPYVPAVKWTLTFRLENYMQSLYPNIHSTPDDWIALTSAAAAQYLPHTAESVQISRLCMKHKVLLHPQKAVKQWKRLKLFEAEVIDGIPMFFAGGPVWAMAWCPVPLQTAIYRTTHTNQYLAVSCHSGMEDKYISGQSYSHSGLIQIWDFGHLDNQQPCSIPKLAVGIAHDYGAVWCMEWCPSGCYDTLDEEVPKCGLRRLGLLGAACSDGTVRIFSICFPSELQDKVCGSIPIFKVEAVRTLVLDDRQTCLLGDSKWQCTRLSWYKGKGHRIIAGCFTNGMVAVWDIATESPLLSKRVGKSYILYPYHSFQAHIGVVSAIALSPQDDGRYLMTGSFDRTTKYWDLEDTSAPITVSKRGSITDGVWLTHWVSAVNSFDDSYSLGHANGTLTPVRQFGFGSYPLLAQNSVAWSLSTCDWMNAVAQSTLAGELTVIFSHQLLIAVDSEKGMRDKRMIISYTDIMHLEDQKEEGSENGDVAEKPNTSQNSASAGLPNEHDVMDVDDAVHINSGCAQPLNVHVDHSSGDRKSQLSFEDMFPKLGSRDSMPVLREGNSAGNMDMNANNCDVSISGSDNARTEGPNTEFRSVDQSPSESLNVSVQSDIESKESAITRNLTHSTLTDSVTYTDRFQNINVSSRTSGLSQYDLSVTDSADAERSFSRESSMAIESMSKADESMKNNVDCPEKMDQDSDKTKDSTGAQVVSYDQAHKKCGLILCDFPTGNLKHMPHEARLWMRQSDKMKTADVDAYPLGSINRVSWNPNCRSFLWLAAGYHCGLVRVPCMQAMYCKPIEDILQHGERKVAALLNKVSKDLQ